MEQQIKYVCKMFGITEEQLFTKSRKRLYADARSVLYNILIDTNPVRMSRLLLQEKNFPIERTSIIHGQKNGLTFYSNLINSYLHNGQQHLSDVK